jgi:predicted amidophosphoribosyltransferase
VCSHCGQPLPADANFCAHCGNSAAADQFETEQEVSDDTIVRPWPAGGERAGDL